MPSKRAKQLQKFGAAAASAELQRATAAKIAPAENTMATVHPTPCSPQRGTSGNAPPSTSSSPAKSPAKSPARITKNSNKPTPAADNVGSPVGASVGEVVNSTAEDGTSTLEATTAEALKKRKLEKSATENVGSSSSVLGRVRNKINRLGEFVTHVDDSDGEGEEDAVDDEDEDGEEDEPPMQPLTPRRSLELSIIQHLKKGRQIKSFSSLGPHPDPNFP